MKPKQTESDKGFESYVGIETVNDRIRLTVDNIKCDGCATTITKALTEKGFKNIEVNLETSSVELDKPEASATTEKVFVAIAELKKLGYPLVETEEGLKAALLKAKSYLSCAIGKMS